MTNGDVEKSKEQLLKEYQQIMNRKAETRGGEYKLNPLAVKYPHELSKSDKELIISQNLEEIERKLEERKGVIGEQVTAANEIDKQKKRVSRERDKEHERLKESLRDDAKGFLGVCSIVFLVIFVLATCNGGGVSGFNENDYCMGARC